MAQFNLADYETVEERIKRFYEAHPDGRIITEDLTTPLDRQVSTWRVKTTIFLTDADQERNLPKATGHAFEVDGSGGANKTSAWENAEPFSKTPNSTAPGISKSTTSNIIYPFIKNNVSQ